MSALTHLASANFCSLKRPYGVDTNVYRYDAEADWFEHQPNYELRRATSHAD